jgi:integrase
MRAHNLSETFCERAKPPATGETFYRDRAIRGFALRVNWGGTKSFVLECRVSGRVRRMTLGRWPDLSVTKARKKALEKRSLIAEGVDPTVESDSEKVTFGALAIRYVEYVRAHGKKSWERDCTRLGVALDESESDDSKEKRKDAHFTLWHTRRLSDISRNDVVTLHESIGKQHGKYEANRAVTLLRAMFNLAIDEFGLLPGENQNPAARIKLFEERKRKRFLSPDELDRVNQALLAEPNAFWRAFFPLVCMLGPRKSELLSARWADVDLKQRTWSIPETKSGEPHLLPLPPQACVIIEALPSRGKSEWLFPGVGKTGHLAEPKKAWQRIREAAKVPDVRVHDLRRTFGSWLAGAGYGLPLIGAALNHASPASTAVYARLSLEPVRLMIEKNADLMFGPKRRKRRAAPSAA